MIILFVISFLILPISLRAEILSLNGFNWNVQNEKGDINVSATVPGGIYSDLLSGNIVNEHYLSGFNDVKYRWISTYNWTYSLNFNVPDNVFSHDYINLVFHGLDTVSSIFLNDIPLGETDNMFRRYNFNVKNTLKANDNHLEVRFIPPVAEAKRRFEASVHPIPPSKISDEYNGENYVQMLRKMQCSFAWDWGPAFPSVGIWKDVELISYNPLEIRNVYWRSYNDNKAFEYIIYMETDQKAKFELETFGQLIISLKNPATNSNVYEETLEVEGTIFEGELKIKKNVENLPEINLWWPNGYGNQFLYEFNVTYITPQKIISCKTIKVGFRVIELIQSPIMLENNNQAGETFYFRVNGKDIFIKGANWIPADIFPENHRSGIDWLLNSAKQVNMNMLRVWGGGIYESDEFYQLADELGILIWQDLMYAVYLYPATPEFITSSIIEAKQQTRRLQYHPSIAIWAGNNELETAIVSKWYPELSEYNDILRAEYKTLFAEALAKTIGEEDSYRPYVISSPSNGDNTVEQQGIAENPMDSKWGDVHFYQYTFDGWLTDTYPTPRFASEYGYQSLPEIYSWLKVANESDLGIGTDLLKHREHSPLGFVPLVMQTRYQLPLPKDEEILLPKYFELFIYASQIYQAMAYKIETEHYRNKQSEINEIGEGRTMGSLYWQLNDVWIAPTWSGIDKYGRWKMVHYYALDFYSPYLATAEIDSANIISIYLISDFLENLTDVKFEINIYKWNDFNPIYSKTSSETLNSSSSKQILKSSVNDLLKPSGCIKKEDCFMRLKLKPNSYPERNNFVFLAPLKNSFSQILMPELKVTVISGPEKSPTTIDLKYSYTIEITTTTPTFFTWISFDDSIEKGRFSENGFHLIEKQKIINFYTDEVFSSMILQEKLSIYSFKDKLNLE